MAIVSNKTVRHWVEPLPENPTEAANRIRATITARRFPRRSQWYRQGLRLLGTLDAWQAGKFAPATSSIFRTDGNVKLGKAIAQFSAVPATTSVCPGAGDCLKWCYSTKAWRYPSAVYRQISNTIALSCEPGREAIRQGMARLKSGTVLRLYVDGDIHSLDVLAFWMDEIRKRPDLSFYSYSKSQNLFLALDNAGKFDWPKNFRTNQSSGSRFDGTAIADRFADLDCVRGEFVAVAHKGNKGKTGTRRTLSYLAGLRIAGRLATGLKKVFACPGTCSDCLPRGEHACGVARMSGVTIVEGIH